MPTGIRDRNETCSLPIICKADPVKSGEQFGRGARYFLLLNPGLVVINPWSRRDMFGHLIAGGVALHMPHASAKELRVPVEAGASLPNIAILPLFIDASRARLPGACAMVWTGGHSRIGQGAACYGHDPVVTAAYVLAHPRTAFIDADGRGFRLLVQDVNVRQTGAIGDGRADDTAAIQEALAIVEKAGGGIVGIPSGEYRTTAPVTLPARTALRGVGPASVLRVQGCDGIVIAASDGIGPRSVCDFMVHGQECEDFSAIVINIPDNQRAQGIVFERLYLSFFGTGVRSRGLWHATFRTVTMNQVWSGLVLNGRNVKITIDDCRITHGGLLRKTGDTVGVQVGDAPSATRPEDVQIDRSIIYGFDKAIVWRTALFGGVQNCDLDACVRTGLELITADGGFTFANNWIQVEGAALSGISCSALGYNPHLTNILIANNHIVVRAPSPGSCGIAIGNQQSDLTVEGNGISGPWENGIHANGVRRLCVRNNKVESRIVVERCTDVAVEQNFAGAGVHLSGNSPPGTSS